MTFLEELDRVLPAGRVVTDPDRIAAVLHDHAPVHPAGTPRALAIPRSTQEVAAAVRTAAAWRVPVVARGGGTGLAGGANAVDGCLTLSLTELNAIIELDVADRLAVVQPGVITADLRAAAAEVGLFYPPDPASMGSCTIGGNIATNAGGMCCVKYGVTSDFVRDLEVVLASGEVIRTGHRTVKGVTGYDLTGLMTGSEGTLGIITEATLTLRPAPAPAATVVAQFSELSDAGTAISRIVAAGLTPSMLELMDHTVLQAIEAMAPSGLADAQAMLLAQSDAIEAEAEVAAIAGIAEAAGATAVSVTTAPEEGIRLTAARRLAHTAMERHGTVLVDDVAVPPSKVPALIGAIADISERLGLTIGVVGHAGEGNLHPLIVFEADDEAQSSAAHEAFGAILAAGLALGGTVTAEHGVGLLKRDWVLRELGEASLRLQHAVRAAFDPNGLLNPGKRLPPR